MRELALAPVLIELTHVLGLLGIAASGAAAFLAVLFTVAALWSEHRNRLAFIVPLALMFWAGVIDRYLVGGALLSGATTVDMSTTGLVMSAASRLVILIAAAWLAASCYRVMAARARERIREREEE